MSRNPPKQVNSLPESGCSKFGKDEVGGLIWVMIEEGSASIVQSGGAE